MSNENQFKPQNNNNNNEKKGYNNNTSGNKEFTMKFVPQSATMLIESRDLASALLSHLKPLIPGLVAASFVCNKEGNGFKCSIGIDPQLTSLIKTSFLSAIGAQDAYSVTDELRNKLRPYLGRMELRTNTVKGQGDRDRVLIDLDANIVITKIIEPAGEGYGYAMTIEKTYDGGKSFLLRLDRAQISFLQSLIKPNKNKNKNKNHNRNNRHNNNNNHHNNRYNRY